RKAKPVNITVPAKSAKPEFASADYTVKTKDGSLSLGWWMDSYANFRTQHLGPQITDGSLSQHWEAHFSKGAKDQYAAITRGKVKRHGTGDTRHFKAGEFAKVNVTMGEPASGKKGVVNALGMLPGSSGAFGAGQPQTLPGTRTLHLSAVGGAKWDLSFSQQTGVDAEGWPVDDAWYLIGS